MTQATIFYSCEIERTILSVATLILIEFRPNIDIGNK